MIAGARFRGPHKFDPSLASKTPRCVYCGLSEIHPIHRRPVVVPIPQKKAA
jgi:hypothetical protein